MAKGPRRPQFGGLLTALAVATSMLAQVALPSAALGAPFESDDPIPNPNLEVSCGLDVLMILDESGSIASSGATNDIRDAYRTFVSTLRNTGSRVAVVEFSKAARLAIDEYTVVTDSTIASTFEPYIANNYSPNGNTNWEDAMRAARYFLPRPSNNVPHLVVFITDGDPTEAIDWGDTTYDPGNPNVSANEYELKIPLSDSETSGSDSGPGADRAVSNANAVKGNGSHVLAIGVGSALQNESSFDRLVKVSGDDVFDGSGTFDIATDDVFAVPNFDELTDALRDAAFQLCSPSITVQKLVDLTPDPDTNDAFPGQGWEMTATVAASGGFEWVIPPGASGATVVQETDGAGFASFQWTTNESVDSTVSIVEEDPATGPVPDLVYDPGSTACTYQNPDFEGDRDLAHTDASLGIDLDIPADSIVTCQMVNRAPAVPGITLEKRTNGVDADDPPDAVPVPGNNVPVLQEGEAVEWTYEVTNTGNVTLDIAVTDDPAQSISCPTTSLAPGEATACTADGTAQDTSGLTGGYYENTAVVEGTDPFGTVVDATDPSHYIGVAPADLTIEKSTNTPSGGSFDADNAPGPLVPVGGDVSWTYVVTNTSTTSTLENLVVTDPTLTLAGGAVDCGGVTVLAPEDSITCASSITVAAVAGLHENVAYASANTEGLPDDTHIDSDPSHHFGTVTGITLEKWTNGTDADSPDPGVNPIPQIPAGEEVLWAYIVTNVGNLPVISLAVTDDQGVDVTCPRTFLGPDATMVCTAGGTAENTLDFTDGVYANVGSVSGTTLAETGAGGDTPAVTVSDSDPSHYLGTEPDIDIEKYTNGEDADLPPGPFLSPGDTVTWTYEVTNTGNIDLARVAVVDPWLGLGGVSCPQNALAIGEAMTCSATGTAEPDQYRNGAFALGVTANPQLVMATDPSHYLGASGTINLEKWTAGIDADTVPEAPFIAVDEEFNWTFLVRNEGNTTMTNIVVVDDQLGPIECPQDTLAPAELMTCPVPGTAVAGLHANTATVTATDASSASHTDIDPSHYIGYTPGIDVEKSTNGADADTAPGVSIGIGDTVVWRYEVTTGGLPVSNVVLTDDDPDVDPVYVGGDDDGDGVLDFGETWIYEASATAGSEQYTNTATVDGYDVLSEEFVSDADPSNYQGVLPITGGGPFEWRIASLLILAGLATLYSSRRITE